MIFPENNFYQLSDEEIEELAADFETAQLSFDINQVKNFVIIFKHENFRTISEFVLQYDFPVRRLNSGYEIIEDKPQRLSNDLFLIQFSKLSEFKDFFVNSDVLDFETPYGFNGMIEDIFVDF
ncbi:MAG: hypothetical protein LBM27_06530 [Lactobacillaceae bacterium]|nr:hypothetical protein [Lactobacillaceae bacterium]